MGIRSMVEESLGFVTDADREQMHAWERGVEAEKEEDRKGTAATMMNSGVGTALDLGERVLQAKAMGESTGHVAGRRKVRTVRTIEESHDVGPDDDYGLG